MQRTHKRNLAVLGALAIATTVAVAASHGQRIGDLPLTLGQSTAVTEKVVFDIGSGAANPVVESTSAGVLQLSNDQTNFVIVPSANDTMCVLAAAQTLTNKTLGSTDTLTGARIASFTPDGTHTLTAPAATDTIADLAGAQALTNKDISSTTNTYRIATATQGGAFSTGTDTVAGNKIWNDVQTWKYTGGTATAGSYDTSGQWTFGSTAGSSQTHVFQSNGATVLNLKGASGSNADLILANGATSEWTMFNNAGSSNALQILDNSGSNAVFSVSQLGNNPTFAGTAGTTLKIQAASANNADIALNNGTTTEWTVYNNQASSNAFQIQDNSGTPVQVFSINQTGTTPTFTSNGATVLKVAAALGNNADLALVNNTTTDWTIYNNAGASNKFQLQDNSGTPVQVFTVDQTGLTPTFNSNQALHFHLTAASGNNTDLFIDNGATNEWLIFNNTGASNELDILDAGGATRAHIAQGVSGWVSGSDIRIKRDLKPIENGLAKVATLRPVTYRMKSDPRGRREAGLIAQDVERVLPEAVVKGETWGLVYERTIPLLVSAIQDLKAQNEALAARLAAIEERQ
jgi:hypothetical protein